MRVLHITNGPDSGATEGIVKAVADLALGQRTHGYDVVIAIDRPTPFTETCREHGIQVEVTDNLGPHPSVKRPNAHGTAQLAENTVQNFVPFLQSLSPDIIHCHSMPSAHLAIAAGNHMGISCILTGDGPEIIVAGRRSGLRFAVLCLNNASFDSLKNEPSVYYVPHGARAVLAGQEKQPVKGRPTGIIMVSSLIQRKGCDTAVLAMFELRRRLGPDCPVLNIYGDGQLREYLTEMVSVLGLTDVIRFHGFELGILGVCPSTDLLLMPARWEAGPLVVLEAMSRGMPIVATDVGDVASMLPDRRYGRVVPADSIVAMAEAIESLLADVAAGQFDPDLLIERHRAYYSIEKWTERVDTVYKEVLLNTPAPVRQTR